ncbi:MAG: HEAT repeat domain-containing protein [Planctomycetia bacterium]|nr:HEAT repeat domain-containing protein [Planctomycetia bacterium]
MTVASDVLDVLRAVNGPQREEALRTVAVLQTAVAADVDAVFESVETAGRLSDEAYAALGEQLWRRYHVSRDVQPAEALLPSSIERIARLYKALGPGSTVRHHFLRALAAERSREALERFAELLAGDPPEKIEHCDLALVPLFERKAYPAEALFPRLLEAIARRRLAAAVLDLANFVTRQKMVSQHPAKPRAAQLVALCGEMVQHLLAIQENPDKFAKSAAELSTLLGECAGLLTALCDALAWIGDQRAVPKLRQALELKHRRLRAEAASALARLGDDEGVTTLVELTAEPVVRTRAIQYLDELGLSDKVEPKFREPAARAEGDVAAWLAHPSNLGLPPHRLELVDSRLQVWPGRDQPVDCFLFRFEYDLPQGRFSGIAMAGPIVHVLSFSVEGLPIDDVYAAFAGWDARHAEMAESAVESLEQAQRRQVEAVAAELAAACYDDVQPVLVGRFFGEEHVVATARRHGQAGVVVVRPDGVDFFPQSGPRPLAPGEVYLIVKGRLLLRLFNG